MMFREIAGRSRRVKRLATTTTLTLAAQSAVGVMLVHAFTADVAFAQAAEQAPDPDAIVVTARRREESLQNAPVAVAALTGAKLNQYVVVNVSDLAKFVPGMVVGKQVTGSSASIFLRGVGSSSLSAGFDQSVSFNIDGIAMSRGREIGLAQYDLRSVQVMKGPQALFFGKNATGGVIAVDSNNPGNKFEGSLSAGYGFQGNETYVDGYLSGPLTDTLGARFAFHANNTEGYFRNTAGTAADMLQQAAEPNNAFVRDPTDSRRGASKSAAGRLTLLYKPNDALTMNLKMSGNYYTDNGASDLYERKCAAGRTIPAATSGAAAPFADCQIDGRSDHARLPVEVARTMRYTRADGKPYTKLVSGSSVLNTQYETEPVDITSITAFYGFRQTSGDDMNGQTRAIWNSQKSTMKQFSEELRAGTKFDGPVNFTVGAYYAHVDFTYNIDSYTNVAPLDPVTQTYATLGRNSGFKGETWSGFFEAILTPTPELEISGGARYSHESKNSYEQFLPENSRYASVYSQNLLVNDKYREANLSPQATIRWKPSDAVTAYAAYKEGFKAGGYNISQVFLASTTLASALANGRFGAETARGFEGGIRTTLLGRSLHFNVTAYRYKYADLQVQFYNPQTLSQSVANAGALRVQGIESDFTYRVPGVRGLDFHGSLAYNDAEYQGFIGQCYAGQTFSLGCNQLRNAAGIYNGQIFSGRTPPKAPKLGAQFGSTLEVPVSGDIRATFTGDVTYSSKYNYTDTLRPDAVQNRFARVDASVAVGNEAQGWRLSLIGRNLTDKLVVTSANDMTFTGGTGTGSTTAPSVLADLNAVVERGREIYLEARFKF
ncbi:TonB-dependent receptor [Sphingobium sp. EM0848]|uniref:TonB-dependent receptor n=1 Tax=Sphingobium sp. EM0848 TaxID=2743473 RepID=UPI00159C00EB|nr:TonB-dependent receptor [Sphingobium sp. EM0848]